MIRSFWKIIPYEKSVLPGSTVHYESEWKLVQNVVFLYVWECFRTLTIRDRVKSQNSKYHSLFEAWKFGFSNFPILHRIFWGTEKNKDGKKEGDKHYSQAEISVDTVPSSSIRNNIKKFCVVKRL